MNSNEVTLNYQYAPGIPTYGINGKNGSTGISGTGFFFSNYIIKSDSEDYNEAIGRIKKNLVLSKKTSDIDSMNVRNYIAGDIIIDSAGNINRLKDDGSGNLIFEFLTTLTAFSSTDYFKRMNNSDRIYLDTVDSSQVKGLDIISGSSDFANSILADSSNNSLLRVITSTKNSANTYNLLSLISKSGQEAKYLDIKYNEDEDAFIFNTNSNLVFDTSYGFYVNVDDKNDDINAGYYKIRPYADPIGLLHHIYADSSVYSDSASESFYICIPEALNVNIDVKPEFIKLYTVDASFGTDKEFIQPVLPENWKHVSGNYAARIIVNASVGFPNVRYISLCKGIEFMKSAILSGDTLSGTVIAAFA